MTDAQIIADLTARAAKQEEVISKLLDDKVELEKQIRDLKEAASQPVT